MRRRRQAQVNDSFDMMLDTITNAFGGIVLLALLVTLIIGNQQPAAGPQNTRSNSTQIADLQTKNAKLNQERIELEAILANKKLQLSLFSNSESEALVKQALESQQKEQQLVDRLNQDFDKMAQMSQMINDLENALKETLNKKQSEIHQLAIQKIQLSDEKKRRVRNLDTPRETITHKAMSIAVAKGSRLFVLDENYGSGGFKVNLSHFTTCDQMAADIVLIDGSSYKTQVTGGIPLDKPEQLASVLKRFDAENVYIVIIAYGDSFEHFHAARDGFVENRLEHKILPIDRGPVYEGRSTAAATAQ